MANLIKLKIVTPDGVYFENEVDIVTVKTTEGYIGLQYGNVPMVASLVISKLFINSEKSPEHEECAISGGVLYVSKEEVTIITEAIEKKEDIDILKARKMKEDAESLLKVAKDEYEIRRLEVSLKKAINRINVSEGNKGV